MTHVVEPPVGLDVLFPARNVLIFTPLPRIDKQYGQRTRIGGHGRQILAKDGTNDQVDVRDVDIAVIVHIGGIAVEGVIMRTLDDRVDQHIDISDVYRPVTVHVTARTQTLLGIGQLTAYKIYGNDACPKA